MQSKLRKGFDLVIHEWTLQSRLCRDLKVHVNDLKQWFKEAREISQDIQQKLRPACFVTSCINRHLGMHSLLRGQSLFVLYRAIQPSLIVETGVASGISSFFALCAIRKNKMGKLVSLDLPNQEGALIPGGKPVGWIIPENLKEGWDLRLGPSQESLPRICQEVQSIDIFFHDSLHTYEHMLWEFRTAWPKIKSNGFLIADDIIMNSAFDDFSKETRAKFFKTYHRFGWIHKL